MGTRSINCEAEGKRIDQEKSGEIIEIFENDDSSELLESISKIKEYLIQVSAYNILTLPIPDQIYNEDLAEFQKKMPEIKHNLMIYYSLFQRLVMKYTDKGFTNMKISFTELNTSHFNEVDFTNVDRRKLNNMNGKLYGIVSFINTDVNPAVVESYLLFNLRNEYQILVDINDIGNNFEISSLGQILKSKSSNHYLPFRIDYKLNTVREYIDRIDNYLGGCVDMDVYYLEYDFCFGDRKIGNPGTIKNTFYLSSIPVDTSGRRMNANFPYYDQGSLEP